MNTTTPPTAMQSELAELQQQIELLDLPRKIKRERQTSDARDQFATDNSHRLAVESVRIEQLALEGEATRARAQRSEAERAAKRIARDIDRLTALLTVGEREVTAQQEIAAATTLNDAAQLQVTAALAAVAELDRQVATATQAFEDAKRQAGAAVLAQIKAGTRGKIPPVNRDHLDALLLAQEAAAGELATTQDVLTQCAEGLKQAQHEHAQVLADGTARELYTLSREYAGALARHKMACYASGQEFDAPDLDLLARLAESDIGDGLTD